MTQGNAGIHPSLRANPLTAVIPAKAEALYSSEAGQSIYSEAQSKRIPTFAEMTASEGIHF